ncbi:MAG: cyclic nucleotide-binding domain-containing protein [Pseudomonadota bacterium]
MELAKQTGPIGPVNGNLRVDEDNESRWQSDDIERLRSFPALRSLDEAIFHLVLEHATLESANVGALVHIDGAPREVLAFLLDGAVECNAGTVEALGRETPIAPGQWTATANARVVKVDLGIANIAAVWLFAQAGDPNLDWIPRFVQSNWFERLPKTAAYRMFVNAERIRTKKGEQLYAKSEPAGHGYVVLNGAVALSTDTGKQQLLPGASFGDEVFNDAPRAADAEMAKTGEILSCYFNTIALIKIYRTLMERPYCIKLFNVLMRILSRHFVVIVAYYSILKTIEDSPHCTKQSL